MNLSGNFYGWLKMFKLPSRMEEIWLMKARGLREIEIAEKLNISKQAVNKAIREAKAKLFEMFLGLAEVFGLEVIRVNVEKGFMVANMRIRGDVRRVYLFYLPRIGVKAFFDNYTLPEYLLKYLMKVDIIKDLSVEELINQLEE